MIIRVPTFRGMMNAASSRLLPVEQAIKASNCETRTGDLEPTRASAAIGDLWATGEVQPFEKVDILGPGKYDPNGAAEIDWIAPYGLLPGRQYRLYVNTSQSSGQVEVKWLLDDGSVYGSFAQYHLTLTGDYTRVSGVCPLNCAGLRLKSNSAFNGVITIYALREEGAISENYAAPDLENGTETLFLYSDTHWFSWDKPVHAIASPIAEDPHQRVYFTGDGPPKYTSSSIATGNGALPFASYKLGLDPPGAPMAQVSYYDPAGDLEDDDSPSNYEVEPSGFINLDTSDDESRFYVCTLVSAYGEESAPSAVAGELVLYSPNDAVSLAFSDNDNFGSQNIVSRRIYRTASSSDITAFYLVAEIPATQHNYLDTRPAASLGAELTTQEYDKPPANLEGLILTSAGVAIGFVDNTIVPSEAALPYAWPVAYRQALPDTIMGLAEMSGGIVIATDNKPAIMTGVMPDSFTITVLDAAFPCVSKASLVDMGESALYASHDGLVSVSQSGARLLSQPVLSKKYWQSLNPETIRAYRWNDYYVAFHSGNAGFMVDMRTGDFCEIDAYYDAAYFNSLTGELIAVDNNQLVVFGSGEKASYNWQSREFDVRNHTFSWIKVQGQGLSNSRIQLIGDGVTLFDQPLNGDDPTFRLPPFRVNRLHFVLTGTGVIEGVTLASSAEELRSVQN